MFKKASDAILPILRLNYGFSERVLHDFLFEEENVSQDDMNTPQINRIDSFHSK